MMKKIKLVIITVIKNQYFVQKTGFFFFLFIAYTVNFDSSANGLPEDQRK